MIIMDYLKKLNMLCLSIKELEQAYYQTSLKLLNKELLLSTNSSESLLLDKEKMNEMADKIVSTAFRSKESIEFFIALDTCSSLYDSADSRICFVLKNGISPNGIKINYFEDLKKVVEEKTLTDFAIWSNKQLRQFQLKQYRGVLSTEELFEFIKQKISTYGNDLGETNLLVMLQGNIKSKEEIQQAYIDFNELYSKLKKLKFNFSGQILVANNEANEFYTLHQIYPELKKLQKKMITQQ